MAFLTKLLCRYIITNHKSLSLYYPRSHLQLRYSRLLSPPPSSSGEISRLYSCGSSIAEGGKYLQVSEARIRVWIARYNPLHISGQFLRPSL